MAIGRVFLPFLAAFTAAASCGGGSGMGDGGQRGERVGFVSLYSGHRQTQGDDPVPVSWGAVFDENSPACRDVPTISPCRLLSCGAAEMASRAATAPHAGAIAVTGTRSPIMMVPGADGRYEIVERTGPSLFEGGETVGVSSGGAEVPAFSLTMKAPLPLLLTAPRLTTVDGVASVPVSGPLTFSWPMTAATDVGVSVFPRTPPGGNLAGFLFCPFWASALGGQIPMEALQAARTLLGARLVLTVRVRGSAAVVASGWRVSSSIATNALIPVEGAPPALTEVEIVLE